MKKALSTIVIFTVVIFTLSNCAKKSNDPVPTSAVKEEIISNTSNQIFQEEISGNTPNEFTITGDGYTNELIIIDTAAHEQYRESYGNYFNDSLQLGISGSYIINNVSKYINVGINTHFTGLGTYPIENTFTGTRIVIYSDIQDNGYSEFEYSGLNGSITFTSIANGFIEGTYSGEFMIDGNTANTVTITDGKFICPIVTH